MDHEFHSIIEKLAILEGRIAPQEKAIAESKQKKPALFNNLKKTEATPVDEAAMGEDVVSKVKASLADYLKSTEDDIKQDKDLIKKKKQDLDIKKKELKDLDLQKKETEKVEEEPIAPSKGTPVPAKSFAKGVLKDLKKVNVKEAPGELQPGDRVCVIGQNEHQGEFAEVVELSPSGKFVVISLEATGDEVPMHLADVELTTDESDWDDEEVDNDTDDSEFVEGDTYATDGNSTYATGGNPTYASESAPVKTMEFELNEMGGSVLVEIHGDERQGFCIKRAGKELGTRFKSLAEAEMALEMFAAHRERQLAADQSADYIEEK